MASKRQRKKEQRKQAVQIIKKVKPTLSKRETKLIIRDEIKIKQYEKELKELEKARIKRAKQDKRNAAARERRSLLKKHGINTTEYKSKLYMSETNFNKWLEEKLDEMNPKKILLMFWRPKTDYDEDYKELYNELVDNYQHMHLDYLIDTVKGWLQSMEDGRNAPAPIGKYGLGIANNHNQAQAMKQFYNMDDGTLSGIFDWLLIYEGNTTKYKQFILKVHAMIRMLYDTDEKYDFMSSLAYQYLPKVNEKTAKRFIKDFF